MDRLGSSGHFCTFKRNVLTVQPLEQARAAAEQHGNEVDKDFVNESALEELPGNVCTHDGDILLACQCLRCFIGSFDAIHEAVHTTLGDVPGYTVRNDDRGDP